MLVLTLKENQKVIVPVVGIVITVVRIDSNRVRLGFEAPKSVKILRECLIGKPNGKKQDCGNL